MQMLGVLEHCLSLILAGIPPQKFSSSFSFQLFFKIFFGIGATISTRQESVVSGMRNFYLPYVLVFHLLIYGITAV